MKKTVTIIAAVLALLVLSAAVAVYAVWHNELASVASFRQIRTRNDPHDDGSVYELHIKGGYYMDELLAQGGVASDSELISFAVEHITKGLIPVSIKNPEIGCSSFTAQTAAGDKLFARNYDMRKTNTCIVHTESGNGRHATISTVDLGLLGMDADTDVEGLLKKITCLAALRLRRSSAALEVSLKLLGRNSTTSCLLVAETEEPMFSTWPEKPPVEAEGLEGVVRVGLNPKSSSSAGSSAVTRAGAGAGAELARWEARRAGRSSGWSYSSTDSSSSS